MKDRLWLGMGLGMLIVTAGWLAFRGPAAVLAKSPQAGKGADRGGLVESFGVGGVLTRDGELWQYRPDREKWVTLDESFGLEGTKTKLIPLPVPAAQVKLMETFGFLITWSDECWLYDLEAHEWKNIGSPPFHGQGR